ncbi:MAG: 5-formyltetrahydrofolate cyclo-ligase [Lysobacteraceae bacterium]
MPPNASARRNELRAQLRQRRRALFAAERMAAAQAVAQRLRELPILQTRSHVAGYWATDGELPLHALLAPAPGFVYCLPCLAPGKTLRFAPWRFGDALVQNRYGIPEPELSAESQLPPEAMSAVLVPLTAFDRTGRRLGSGGGYYDRAFAFLREQQRPATPLLIGIGYSFQEIDALPGEDWDVPLDLIVTERETIHPPR